MPSPHQPETASPVIDAFLRGAVMRRLQGTERRERLHELFLEVEDRADPFDMETKPLRIMVLWRITRAMAIVTGLCSDDETLEASTEIDPSPWVIPYRPVGLGSGAMPLRAGRVARFLRTWGGARLAPAHEVGLPLLPPRTAGQADLERWCTVASIAAGDLGIERSPEGLLGLQGLLDPKQATMCDVTPDEILAFEEVLLTESLDMLLDYGERATLKHFKSHYGFANKEAAGLIRVVKTQALQRSAASVEEKRALMEMRYENMLGRYKETMDMDGELKASKELAKIQGLTRTEPENQAAEFFDVIKRVSAKQDLLEQTVEPVLIASETVEPIILDVRPAGPDQEDHDDAAALAEYDRENQHNG